MKLEVQAHCLSRILEAEGGASRAHRRPKTQTSSAGCPAAPLTDRPADPLPRCSTGCLAARPSCLPDHPAHSFLSLSVPLPPEKHYCILRIASHLAERSIEFCADIRKQSLRQKWQLRVEGGMQLGVLWRACTRRNRRAVHATWLGPGRARSRWAPAPRAPPRTTWRTPAGGLRIDARRCRTGAHATPSRTLRSGTGRLFWSRARDARAKKGGAAACYGASRHMASQGAHKRSAKLERCYLLATYPPQR